MFMSTADRLIDELIYWFLHILTADLMNSEVILD